ncbi:MarR family winged helix-turn-helix transcriptional regulator [Tuwongella immobilis]|uniref:HTH marR-type domain-containing protein n=1 Tax=Tuwongella immobilis TaxID=692036 RepID=A0A6C2YV94_9BACT|nr:MarR family winged helix-turn-helix transcriptional regulator [Tuwongella immobilis]VIP04792.1 family transcriptional regulator : Transcriptional regulator, MarR family OS=Pirellula staleyi (strain ATCC 27377 / DSM 6068 / ICPB 4128) GN=Psta_4122 PE=4 SV=1: MarR_2 [Tuwongella immobilis]VTS06943.1 family transcriptional regulator : Transcriptional regulator, MarR family OS=Pirellula staleyi (strain ATCC 27377 / DSM 6068 / ICPB 4128) GN=Psta_4122 PE=4 SV=1: MarR_2 [Tuwongella immobilis]
MTTISTSTLETHTGYWLRYVSNHVSHAFAQQVEAQGVTVAEWVLLREMLGAGATNPSLLAEKLGMTRGAISKLVERLSRKKLVVRAVSEGDRRYQTIELTEAGARLVPILAQLADENDRQFFGHLSLEDRNKLVCMLQEIVRRHGWKNVPVE